MKSRNKAIKLLETAIGPMIMPMVFGIHEEERSSIKWKGS